MFYSELWIKELACVRSTEETMFKVKEEPREEIVRNMWLLREQLWTGYREPLLACARTWVLEFGPWQDTFQPN